MVKFFSLFTITGLLLLVVLTNQLFPFGELQAKKVPYLPTAPTVLSAIGDFLPFGLGTPTIPNIDNHTIHELSSENYKNIADRHSWYAWADRRVRKQKDVYWFAAASDVTSWSMVGAVELSNLWFSNDFINDLLAKANCFLLEKNFSNFGCFVLYNNSPIYWNEQCFEDLAGIELDQKMVVIEMTILQTFLDDYKTKYIRQKGIDAWLKSHESLKKLFENSFLRSFTPNSNKFAHQEFLKKYGQKAKFDFMDLEHRIFQGQKMVEYLRKNDSP